MLIDLSAWYEDNVIFAVSLKMTVVIKGKASVEHHTGMTLSAPILLDKPIGELYKTQALIALNENLVPHTFSGAHPFDCIKDDSVVIHKAYSVLDGCKE